MIYRFRIVSDEVSNFKRDIEIDADATFLDLRNAISDAVGYRKDPMASFIICDDYWEKEKEITIEDMNDSGDPLLMDECVLADYLEDEGQKMMYVFDYLTNRSFYIVLKETTPGKHLDAPVCVASVGEAPAEAVDLDDFDALNDALASKAAQGADEYGFDDDYSDQGGYNDEDIIDFNEMDY